MNKEFMESSISDASKGLSGLTTVNLFPGMIISRFASTKYRDRYFTAPWWISFSPFEALEKYAKIRKQSLSEAALECLAIGDWSNADVLVKAVVKKRLAAWSGTPKTQVKKVRSMYTGVRWEPDRDITQLFIPGLYEADPNDSKRKIWENALNIVFTQII
jgi:hypothetical protein